MCARHQKLTNTKNGKERRKSTTRKKIVTKQLNTTQNTKLELASVEEEEEKNVHRGHSCFSSEQYVESEKLYS